MDAITPQDVLIIVAGVTGSGKSSFIESLVADGGIEIGHDLLSCTSAVDFFPLQHHSGRRIFLVDTPGFDDTYKTDGEILQALAFVLAQTYSRRLMLAGVVYTHPITTNRLGRRASHSLEILKTLCGEQAYSGITLVTTMWDVVGRDPSTVRDAVQREKSLANSAIAWRTLCNHGANVMRWERNQGGSSAAIVDHIVHLYSQRDPVVLSIQEQLVDEGQVLSKTDVGLAISQAIGDDLMKLYKETGELRAELQQEENNVEDEKELRMALSNALQTIEGLQQSQNRLLADFKELTRQQVPAYARALGNIQEHNRKSRLTGPPSRGLIEMEAETQRVAISSRGIYNKIDTPEKRDSHHNDSEESLTSDDDDEKYGRNVLKKRGNNNIVSAGRGSGKSELSNSQDKIAKRQVLQRNLVPLLEILVGIGIAGAGAAVPPMIAPGIAAVVAGISNLDFSRTKDKESHDGGLFGRFKGRKSEKHTEQDEDGTELEQ